MPYTERMCLLLGIGFTLIAVGWFVLAYDPLHMNSPVMSAATELATPPAPATPEGEAPAVPAEGELQSVNEGAATEGQPTVEGEAVPEGPTTVEGEAAAPASPATPEGERIEGEATPPPPAAPEVAPLAEPTPDTPPAPEGESPDGDASYPLPEEPAPAIDNSRDAPIQMIELHEPAAPAFEGEGAVPQE